MKNLILVLTVAFMLVAGTASAATYNCIMLASENNGTGGGGGYVGPPITSDYFFTIETDDVTGDVIAFKDLFSNYFYAHSAGGYDPRDGGPFTAGERIFPSGAPQTVSQIRFDGNTVGTTLWFRGQSNPTGPFGGLVFNVGIIDMSFDGIDGAISYGPNAILSEHYNFHSAPLFSANAGPDIIITRADQTTTVIEGSAFNSDAGPLTYRWLEGMDELSPWQDAGENGEAYLDLSSITTFSIGAHALILEVNNGEDVASDEMILTINNSIPIADAGSDQAVFNVVTLDGGASNDPDGVIELYHWTLLHREDALYDQTAEGQNPTIDGLEPGFYDVTLTVTDDDGVTDTDTMLLAAAGHCQTWPQPNAELNIKKFDIKNLKQKNRTFTNMLGSIDLPDLDLQTGDSVQTRITIELFDALNGGGDVVISDETTLSVKDRSGILMIKK